MKGFSLVELVISLVVITITALGVGSYTSITRHQNHIAATKGAARLGVYQIRQLLRNDAHWALTLAAPSNTPQLKCLRLPFDPDPSCTNGPIANGGLELFRAPPGGAGPGQLVYSTKPGTTFGIDRTGAICTGFDAANGNDDCPFRIEFDLFLQCGSPCEIRNLQIRSRFMYSPRENRSAVRFVGVIFEENRLLALTVDDSNCTTNGGTFDATTRTCTLPTFPVACASTTQSIVGFLNDLPLCEDI